MAGEGGYQRPTSPAPVSGPGALSQRTDGGPGSTQAAQYVSGLPYGEGQALMNIQQAAPMSAAPSAPTPTSGGAAAPQMGPQVPLIPLNAPSQRPDEPVTAGADAGEGPGMAALGLGQRDAAADFEFRTQIASYMPMLMRIAAQPSTSPDTRNVIRQLRELL